jgi:hypothetical protein
VLVYPLGQAVNARRSKIFLYYDAAGGLEPANEKAHWADGHSPLHPHQAGHSRRINFHWIESRNPLLRLKVDLFEQSPCVHPMHVKFRLKRTPCGCLGRLHSAHMRIDSHGATDST